MNRAGRPLGKGGDVPSNHLLERARRAVDGGIGSLQLGKVDTSGGQL